MQNLNEILELSETNPKWLIAQIDKVRNLQKDKKPMPKDLLKLSKYVSSKDALQKKGFPECVLLDEYFLSYATPLKYAEHRANKIKAIYPEKSLIDISCGSGLQLIEFCKHGIKCAGIEKDNDRYLQAKININLAHYLKLIKIKPEIYLEDALSKNSKAITKDYDIIFCDSFRENKKYYPSLQELHKEYNDKDIVYEFIPTENIDNLLTEYSLLKNNSIIEFYGERDRCSRITAYLCNKDKIEFYQNDDFLQLELSYKHNDLDKIQERESEKEFPKEFITLNKCIIENHFDHLLKEKIFKLDKRRYLLASNKYSKRIFTNIYAAQRINAITAYLKENYKDYYTTLRFELDPKDYWRFINNNSLITNKESKNKFSLFKYKDIYFLCKEN
jgi:hypothetical protein